MTTDVKIETTEPVGTWHLVRRLGRFAWKLMCEPLRILVGVAGGLAILFFAWGIGRLCGLGLVAVIALVVAVASAIFGIVAIAALCRALCRKVRDAWEESA